MMKKMVEEWTEHEKNVFLTLLQVSGPVTEGNKKIHSDMFEWDSIQKKFKEMTGLDISAGDLKNKWEEMKVCAKYHLQLGNVSSSEYIKVLAICLGIYNEVDDFDMSKIRTELQVEFQPPKLNFEWDKSLGNRLSGGVVNYEASSGKRKRKQEVINEGRSVDEKRAALLEEEFKLKKLNLERELKHQLVRQKMEIEILDLKKKIMLKRLDLLNKNKVT